MPTESHRWLVKNGRDPPLQGPNAHSHGGHPRIQGDIDPGLAGTRPGDDQQRRPLVQDGGALLVRDVIRQRVSEQGGKFLQGFDIE
jgi:hypothetical protein